MVGFYKFLSFSFAQNDKYKNRIVIFRENEHFLMAFCHLFCTNIKNISIGRFLFICDSKTRKDNKPYIKSPRAGNLFTK